MKIRAVTITLLLFGFISSAQQIGDGRALEITDFSAPLKSGAYQGSLPNGLNPDTQVYSWQHLFVIRHSNDANNHQLQLSSSYAMNDRLFFRKIAGSLDPKNPEWIELATRGTNTFNGNQSLIGNQNLTGDLTIGQQNEISTIAGPASSGAIQIKTNGQSGGSTNRYLRLGWKDNNALFSPALSINDDLNVGIGTINPDSKLAVNGTIHSKEVKVDMQGWSDFVFKKEYKLPTLEEVEKHIAANGHLQNIPSEDEVLKNGINLGEMNAKLLQKIEELTLYSIQQNKKIEEQSKEIETLKALALRVAKIEKKMNQK
jgi:hypothetical protein